MTTCSLDPLRIKRMSAAPISGRVCFFMGIVQAGHTAFPVIASKGVPVCRPAGMDGPAVDSTPAL